MALEKLIGLAAAIAAGGMCSVVSAADLTADFSTTNGNPNGAWTYGYSQSVAPGYTLTPHTATTSDNGPPGAGPFVAWRGTSGGGERGGIGKNLGEEWTSGTVNLAAGEILMFPSSSQDYSFARYTVPADGVYNVSSLFQRADTRNGFGNGVDGLVLVDGLAISTQAVPTTFGEGAAFGTAVPLTAGSTVDFALGSRGEYTYDATLVQASVSLVPEPATLAGAAAAAAGLLIRRRRRA